MKIFQALFYAEYKIILSLFSQEYRTHILMFFNLREGLS